MHDDELQWMYELERFGIKPGLEVMERILEAVGNPEKKWPSVHVAGTNGKGSTCAFTASVLREAGYKTGMYTSPHIFRFNERIQVNGVSISDEDLSRLVKTLREVLKEKDIQATFFEFTTALVFMYFAREEVDIAVIEVGLGGRLDATNLITPVVSAITNIGYDHMEILGKDLLTIAKEKAGIIKEAVPVVTGEKNPEVVQLFSDICSDKKTTLKEAGSEYRTIECGASLTAQCFTLLDNGKQVSLEIGLLGRHQIENAKLAYGIINELQAKGFPCSEKAIQKGFQKAHWPARMQIVSREPLIIADGAHNSDGIDALYEYIKELPSHDVLVVCMKRNKDVAEMAKKIVPLFKYVIVTQASYEPMPSKDLAAALTDYADHIEDIPDVAEAIARAKVLLPASGFLLVTGSLYVMGDALSSLRKVSI